MSKAKKTSAGTNLDNFRVTYADGNFPKGEAEVSAELEKQSKTNA